MDFQDLLSTIERHRSRVANGKYRETNRELQKELVRELYPTLSAIVEAMDERLQDTEQQVVALIQGSLSVIQPDLAQQIFGAIALTRQLVDALENGRDGKELLPDLKQVLAITEEAVLDAASEPDEDEDEDEDEEEGEEGEEEDEPTSDEQAPETPATEAK